MSDVDDRTIETIIGIIDLLDAGEPRRAICAAIGCSDAVVAKVIRQRNLAAHRKQHRRAA